MVRQGRGERAIHWNTLMISKKVHTTPNGLPVVLLLCQTREFR